ncbi:MAG: TolB family protein, partial [Prolixibacteraceae bacterium]
MKKLNLIIMGMLLLSFSINGQEMFRKFSGRDIGNPKIKGNYKYDKKMQKFLLEGAGYNIWFDRDEFHFVYQKVKGDFILSANLSFLGDGINPHRKIGLMIRNSDAEDAVYMDGTIHGDGLTSLQYREEKGAETLEKSAEVRAPGFVEVERKGDEFIFRISKDGQPMHEVGKVTLDMKDEVLAGMFISSHDEKVKEKAQFWNVRLVKPAAEGISGYQQPSPSRLEILDVETGLRRVVYETNEHIEAPNWSRNGKFLIYNSNGRLYKFTLKNGKREIINTDGVANNNNDHGISFDGETLAISSGTEVDGKTKSIIYTVPIEGGIPKRVTPKGPSYWHG